ncbi:hypothetical protein ACTXMZ_13025 [Brachybacterium alimentarium]|uniref:hypothetical protein n=1 Tax=Brachybacterium alimentarium TaxID=47845 RepID=UPI003FD39407
MSTTDLGTTPAPKPGPHTPNRVPTRGAGVNQDDIEARSRIVAMLLPHSRDAIRSTDDLLTVAEWITFGNDVDEEDDD